MTHYALGPVKPHVRKAANEVGTMFNVKTIFGFSAGSVPGSDHPKGLALDYMVYGDRAKGHQIAESMVANATRYNVSYVLWWQQINRVDGTGWHKMENRGSVTDNHKDHVHVSFNAGSGNLHQAWIWFNKPGGLPPFSLDPNLDPNESPYAHGQFGDIKRFLQGIQDPAVWRRVGLVILGGVLLMVAFGQWSKMTEVVQETVNKIKQRGSSNGD